MICRYCPTVIADGRDICHFHAKTLRLRREGRCVWCMRSPTETLFPSTPGSYCVECLTSRIRQGGGERSRVNHWLSNARPA